MSRKRLVFLIINFIFLLAAGICLIMGRQMKSKLYSQQIVSRWAADGSAYAQVSAFLGSEKAITREEVSNVRSTIVTKLTEASLLVEDQENRVWIDAYSGRGQVTVSRNGSSDTVTAMGVGGDFFQFHPFELLSGSYFSENDLMQDKILIEEELAWKLFGGNDIAGMNVWIGDTPFIIAGVYKKEDGRFNEAAYGNASRIYMSYEALEKLYTQLTVECYEVVMPNPISGFGVGTIKEAFGVSEEKEDVLNQSGIEIIENSSRYQMASLFQGLKNFGIRSMRGNDIEYPSWENVARAVEDYEILLFAAACFFSMLPVISFLFYVVKLIKWGKKNVKKAVEKRKNMPI